MKVFNCLVRDIDSDSYDLRVFHSERSAVLAAINYILRDPCPKLLRRLREKTAIPLYDESLDIERLRQLLDDILYIFYGFVVDIKEQEVMDESTEKYFKYPRTPHFPWSPCATSDDKKLSDINEFLGKIIVVTEKMDGENSSLYKDYFHARSLDGRNHPSRSFVKALHSRICHMIPDGWRLCGENVYAKHSIEYNNLSSYFYLFSIWDQNNRCLSWADTEHYAKLLGVDLVPVLYCGPCKKDIHSLWNGKSSFGCEGEGYVLRNFDSFHYDDFSSNVAKFVRENHVQTDEHWSSNWVPNKLS